MAKTLGSYHGMWWIPSLTAEHLDLSTLNKRDYFGKAGPENKNQLHSMFLNITPSSYCFKCSILKKGEGIPDSEHV